MEKKEKKERKILTENRLATVSKRETSFEGLAQSFENGEDGVYNLITNDRHMIFFPKVSITKEDLAEVPFLAQLKEAIDSWERFSKKAEGRAAYIAKQTLIDLRKDQYIIKNAYRRPIIFNHLEHSKHYISLESIEDLPEAGAATHINSASLSDWRVCQAILKNYSRLKEEAWGNFESDTWFLLDDFDRISEQALASKPLYERLIEYKIDGLTNTQIQEKLQFEFGIKHSVEYLSCLWRRKIPMIIASYAEDQFLDWYYLNKERGTYKICSKCGKVKLANGKYFSKNKTSKDLFYSVCKECRNKKEGGV